MSIYKNLNELMKIEYPSFIEEHITLSDDEMIIV